VMVTNQSAVARGIITEKKLLQIHDHLKSLLAEHGVYLDQIYYCPFHPEAVIEKYRRETPLRKPAPGMLHLAAGELDLDLTQCWMVGDDDRDIEAGRAAACRTIFLETRSSSTLRQVGQSQPDFRAANLREAANLIVHYADAAPPFPEVEPQPSPEEYPAPIADIIPPPNDEIPAPPSAEAVTDEKPPARHSDREAPSGLAEHLATRKTISRLPPPHLENPPPRIPVPPVETAPGESPGKESPHQEVLLAQILRELKNLNRQESFTDFSVSILMAGVVQILVLLCVVMALAIWLGGGANSRPDAVHNCLLLALVLQTLTLTLLMVHRHS
jgi:histidinol-phosphate phosphatase family protein